MSAARDIASEIPSLPPYEAALAYRDLVRLEIDQIRSRLTEPVVLKKYDNYLRTYERPVPVRHFTDHNYAQKLVPVLELVRSKSVNTILDAACGNGFEAVLFALHGKFVRANDCTIERYTITSVRAQYYRELLNDQSFSLVASLANVMDERAGLGAHDLVFVQEAISHIHPAEDFLTAVRDRYLGAGGRLVVCDSNGWNPVTRTRITWHLWAERRTIRHYLVELVDPHAGNRFLMAEERLFGPPTMRRMMRAAGLTPEQTWMSGFVPPRFVRRRGSQLLPMLERGGRGLTLLRNLGGFYTIIARNDGRQ